jgi:hypothetical protein
MYSVFRILTPLKHLVSNVLLCPFSDLFFFSTGHTDWLIFLNYVISYMYNILRFNRIDWLIGYCLTSRSRMFHLYGDVTITGEGLKKCWPMLGTHGLWAGRDLYRATPAVTRDLGFSGLIRRTAPFSRLLRHTRWCGGSILTRILTRGFNRKRFINRKRGTMRHWDLIMENDHTSETPSGRSRRDVCILSEE